MRRASSLLLVSRGIARLQITTAEELSVAIAETGLTSGSRYTMQKNMTVSKMGIVCKTSAIGLSQDFRFGIWNSSGTNIADSGINTVVLSRSTPPMVSMGSSTNLVLGLDYYFGVYTSGGSGSRVDGGSGEEDPAGSIVRAVGASYASDGFTYPSTYPWPSSNGPTIILES